MRVELSTPGPKDEADFLAAMRASHALHNPWIFPPLTPEDYEHYLERLGERKAGYIARRKQDGMIVGWLNVSEIIRGALQGAFLGYAGVAGQTGQGYIYEALQQLLHEAVDTHGLHRVVANIQPGNKGSIALARRAGFKLEGFSPAYLKVAGEWRDHERWALRAETWLDSRR